MRTLTLQTQVTADGFMAGPNGEMDWMTFDWSDDLKQYVHSLTEPIDTIVLGRNLAEGFIPHWATKPAGEDPWFVEKMNNSLRLVVSNSLDAAPWGNTEIVHGDLVDAITRLKQQDGAGIIAYGGSTLVQSLLANTVVDDIHLFVNPTAIGAGMPVFAPGPPHRLHLAAVAAFDCGVSVLHYQPNRA